MPESYSLLLWRHGMVNGAVLSLMHWSNAPVTPDLVRRGSSSDSLAQGMADDVPVVVR